MRVGFVALFCISAALTCGAEPLVASAAEGDIRPFVIDDILFRGTPPIPLTLGEHQTALKPGDAFVFDAHVQSFLSPPPTVSVDLSELGIAGPLTEPSVVAGPNTHIANGMSYYPDYDFNFQLLAVGTDVPDGIKNVSVTATDAVGLVTVSSTNIIVDSALPTSAVTDISFSVASPGHGDFMYLSGEVDGTGSTAKVSQLTVKLTDAEGNPVVSPIAGGSTVGYETNGLNEAFAASADGTFSNVPVQLLEFGDPGWIARATNLTAELLVYDEAGNFASSSLSVLIPKTKADLCADGSCVSNVLFLPGIEGSRLYEGPSCSGGGEEKLWEPYESLWGVLRGAGDDKVRSLFLSSSGESVCDDIYTKEDDIIESAGGDIYKSFISEMEGFKEEGTINDWKPIAYDWRLSLDALLSRGAARDGKIYYGETNGATSTPYIEQTLRALAESSQTGKVTIIAHSNGGLLAKALLNQPGGEAAGLVDRVIMVGAPQSGAPAALGSTLVGYNAGIYKYGLPIVSNDVARELAQNSPMAYHLLPSDEYLASVADDSAHPVARFAGDAYAEEISAYDTTIENITELDDFLRASSLNSPLIDYANTTHSALDDWAPPEEVEVSQIAGWGADTVAGIDFYTLPGTLSRKYRPIFTEDGDGVVPVPSALMMADGANVKRYWLNLDSYFRATSIKSDHKDLFEIPSLQDFIKNIITNSTSTLPAYISTSQPSSETANKKLTFFLHSPLTLQLTDASGNVTGLATDDSITEDIPGSSYGEFGEVKYVIVPEGDYELTMYGQASGTFALDIQESSGGVITASSTIANVPTTVSTLASLTISGGVETASALTVDENGDGAEIITVTPVLGETVIYESLEDPEPVEVLLPASVPESVINSTSGGGVSSISTTFSAPEPVTATATSSPQATTTPVQIVEPAATSTIEVVAATRVIVAQVKKEKQAPVIAINKAANIPQPAAAYQAVSQQPLLTRWGRAVYNGLYGFWTALKKLF